MKRYRTPNKIDVGARYGRLVIIKDLAMQESKSGKYRRMCETQCDCGNTFITRVDNLKSGNTESCGCIAKEFQLSGKARYIHGDAGTRFHRIWNGMKFRTNPHYQAKWYRSYKRLGVTLHDDWNNYLKFKEDMYKSYLEHIALYGEKQTTIDRIDPLGMYSKDNCRWATYKVQNNNKANKYATR